MILGFYPAAYQAAFAAEMTEVFARARTEAQRQGPCKLLLFAAREFTGLLNGLVVQHAVKWTARDAYITTRSIQIQDGQLPADIIGAQQRVDQLVRCMEFAIGNHDFVKARRYSNEERVARDLLEKRLGDYQRELRV